MEESLFESNVSNPKETKLIYGESVFDSFSDRAATFEILFEQYQYARLLPLIEESALLHSHVLSSSSKSSRGFTGLVIHLKDMNLSAVPIVEGFVLPHGIHRHPFGHFHLVSFLHNRIIELNPETPFERNMAICTEDSVDWPFSFLNLRPMNRKLFKLCSKMLKKYCKMSETRDKDLERKILVSSFKQVEVDSKILKLDTPALHVWEVFFAPELFELPEDYNLIKGILDSLANLHSDLKKKVLQVLSINSPYY